MAKSPSLHLPTNSTHTKGPHENQALNGPSHLYSTILAQTTVVPSTTADGSGLHSPATNAGPPHPKPGSNTSPRLLSAPPHRLAPDLTVDQVLHLSRKHSTNSLYSR
ncbi:hypothetical protein JRQ81_012293, partial [Phrynocephalus forsythii]